ncbi:hypothetical protein ASPVEDRAFT_57650 [Aspergillus versicolor CBS 583.65]|uniref:MARVEL domain-containing protein n=1 Tax=Aspergillus versicolor CBS 583.65 TaxID=1036611 RepID=A0A1L9Q4F6_ASPVE|nr:uncharacterized protein ASPVEDRAFT_57650 [Aspergillus versicolor CBS 583.65]OJJ08619.1 hypothetical protein ASPVEDRAFT_57650 [Aspergillus versicolor CBS 583.65]
MPRYGALGATFLIARAIQACSLIAIIGLTANFIAEIVRYDAKPPDIFIGTITVTCISCIYTIITSILFIDDILPFLAAGILDFLLLIAVIVVAVVIGKPLSYLECGEIGDILKGKFARDDGSSAYTFATHLSSYLDHLSGAVDYKSWIGMSKGVCVEAKSIWGLSIAMCIMFFFTTICCVCLWRQKKVASNANLGKEIE